MIRLDASAFHPTKDQRQAVNRFNRYILGDAYIKEGVRLYPLNKTQAKNRKHDFDLVERVHESDYATLRTSPNPAHVFKVVLEPDHYSDEKFAIYENYQRVVHRQSPSKITRSGFRQFLCGSPLERSIETAQGQVKRLGSWHQCYYIDEKLVAVGVLDLLPQSVSAVYFMYHDSVQQHALGKLGALREISLAKEAGYEWWCAGLYIHTCVKMRYKGDYSPSYLLEPADNTWHLMDDHLRSRLDAASHYIKLSEDDMPAKGATPQDCEDTNPSFMHVENVDSDKKLDQVPTSGTVFSMLGTMDVEQLLSQVDLDQIALRVRGVDAKARNLVNWNDGSVDDPHSIKGVIAELISAVGVALVQDMCVIFD